MAILLAGTCALQPGDGGLCSGQNPSALPPASSVDDRGTFVLSVGGRKIGMERFEIRLTHDKIEAQAEIQLREEQDGKALNFESSSKLVLDKQFQPLTYSWSQKGSAHSNLEVDFRVSPAKTRYRTVTGKEDLRDFDLPKDVIVLDDNVIHQYELVVDRYGLTAGGKQVFRAFIPQEALPGVLTVEETGTEAVDILGRHEVLRHVTVSTELAQIDLWVDARGNLQRISIPATQFEALRTE